MEPGQDEQAEQQRQAELHEERERHNRERLSSTSTDDPTAPVKEGDEAVPSAPSSDEPLDRRESDVIPDPAEAHVVRTTEEGSSGDQTSTDETSQEGETQS